jgi:hypothetical protein
MRRLLVVLAAAALFAGCADDEPATAGSSPTPAPTAAATESPTPTASPTGTPSPTATEQPAPEEEPSPEEQQGGAGDEEEARVPVQFKVTGGVEPPQVGVPAFLALELIVTNKTPSPVTAQLEGAEPLMVDPGQTGRLRVDGRRPGRYRVDFGDAGTAVIVTGVEPGP